MIENAVACGEAWVSNTLLGSLVDIAGESRDWKRADHTWRRLTQDCHVEPNIISYNAFAKAHMICGRVLEALEVLTPLDAVELHRNFKTVIDRGQLLLIAYHSSPSAAKRRQLQRALDQGEITIRKESNKHAATEWVKLRNAARSLEQEEPHAVTFHDVLVEWKAKHISDMRRWPNHAYGSRYLG